MFARFICQLVGFTLQAIKSVTERLDGSVKPTDLHFCGKMWEVLACAILTVTIQGSGCQPRFIFQRFTRWHVWNTSAIIPGQLFKKKTSIDANNLLIHFKAIFKFIFFPKKPCVEKIIWLLFHNESELKKWAKWLNKVCYAQSLLKPETTFVWGTDRNSHFIIRDTVAKRLYIDSERVFFCCYFF